MDSIKARAEIIAIGLVQGVGFRYYIMTKAVSLGLKGYTKNLFSGEVFTVVEGDQEQIEELFQIIKAGPSHAYVKDARIKWTENKDEFKNFEIEY